MISSWKYKNRIFSFIVERQISEIAEMLHDPEVERYLWFAPITPEGFRYFTLPLIKKQKEAFAEGKYPNSATFTVVKDNELLGVCGMDDISDGHNVVMIGYQLKRSAWGQGTGTCCTKFLLHYAKTYLNIRKLFGDCVTANLASTRILEKCGFTLEGIIREKYELGGKLHDNSWYGLKMSDVSPLPQDSIEEIQ
ncbi:MAG: GNAT family N-acetyltransferase [Planctomycetia bacterium]